MKESDNVGLKFIVIIALCCAGFVGGAVLWFMFSGQFLVPRYPWPGDLFIWCGWSAVIGGFIGYLVSLFLIKKSPYPSASMIFGPSSADESGSKSRPPGFLWELVY